MGSFFEGADLTGILNKNLAAMKKKDPENNPEDPNASLMERKDAILPLLMGDFSSIENVLKDPNVDVSNLTKMRDRLVGVLEDTLDPNSKNNMSFDFKQAKGLRKFSLGMQLALKPGTLRAKRAKYEQVRRGSAISLSDKILEIDERIQEKSGNKAQDAFRTAFGTQLGNYAVKEIREADALAGIAEVEQLTGMRLTQEQRQQAVAAALDVKLPTMDDMRLQQESILKREDTFNNLAKYTTKDRLKMLNGGKDFTPEQEAQFDRQYKIGKMEAEKEIAVIKKQTEEADNYAKDRITKQRTEEAEATKTELNNDKLRMDIFEAEEQRTAIRRAKIAETLDVQLRQSEADIFDAVKLGFPVESVPLKDPNTGNQIYGANDQPAYKTVTIFPDGFDYDESVRLAAAENKLDLFSSAPGGEEYVEFLQGQIDKIKTKLENKKAGAPERQIEDILSLIDEAHGAN